MELGDFRPIEPTDGHILEKRRQELMNNMSVQEMLELYNQQRGSKIPLELIKKPQQPQPGKPVYYKGTIGIILIATGEYWKFVEPFIKSAERYLVLNYKKEYFVLTDHENFDINVQLCVVEHEPWPDIIIHRYRNILQFQELFYDFDYVFNFDVDMIINETIEDIDFLDEIVAVQSPLTVMIREWPFERNPKSTSYTPDGKTYYSASILGGKPEKFLHMISQVQECIDVDIANGLNPQYEEGALNYYLSNLCYFKKLSPEYCYTECTLAPLYTRRIITTLNKPLLDKKKI